MAVRREKSMSERRRPTVLFSGLVGATELGPIVSSYRLPRSDEPQRLRKTDSGIAAERLA